MCIHCCRLRRTPCPPIPYSCPHCPVRTISSSCCSLDSRPSVENPSQMERTPKPPDSCVTLPRRWLEVNRRVIYALAEGMGRSPEAARYAVLRLLCAKYGNVMKMSRKRRRFLVPLNRCPDQDLFSAGGSLFDDRGCLTDPMAPDTLGKLLRMLQDYIFRLRLLNKKYKWYGNGEDREEILPLLGEQDELVRLLRTLFGDSYAVPVPQLLQALNTLDLNSLLGKLKSRVPLSRVKSISDLYSEVAAPIQARKGGDNSGDSAKQIEEVTIHAFGPSKSPRFLTYSQPSKTTLPRRSTLISQTTESLPDEPSFPTNRVISYLQAEMPQPYYEPFSAMKSSTWLSRHPDTERVLPDGRIAKHRVRHYRDAAEQQSMHSENSFGEKVYGDMFGADMQRRKSRRSTNLSTSKLLSAR